MPTIRKDQTPWLLPTLGLLKQHGARKRMGATAPNPMVQPLVKPPLSLSSKTGLWFPSPPLGVNKLMMYILSLLRDPNLTSGCATCRIHWDTWPKLPANNQDVRKECPVAVQQNLQDVELFGIRYSQYVCHRRSEKPRRRWRRRVERPGKLTNRISEGSAVPSESSGSLGC